MSGKKAPRRRGLFWCFAFGECKDKFGTNALCTDDIDILVMRSDDLFDDRKSQSRSFAVFSAGGVELVEALPDFGNACLWNAAAGILDGDEDFAVLLRCLDRDGGIVVAEFDRIIDQIVQHLLDFSHIGADIQSTRCEDQ